VSAKPNLKPTLQALLDRDRQELDDHPTPEELIDYHDGKLAAADEEKLRDHLALCHDCADLLLDLVSFASFTPPDQTPALADSEVETAWQKFQPRLAEGRESKAKELEKAEAPPVLAPVRELRRDSGIRRPPEHDGGYQVVNWQRKLRVAYAIAATLFIGIVGLSVWGVALSKRVSRSLEPKPNTLLDLYTDQETTRGEPETSTVPAETSNFSLILHLNPEWRFDHYEAEIRFTDPPGQTVTVRDLADQEGICSINFPFRGSFPFGSYQVDLYGIEGVRREKVGQYIFHIASHH
jgi:hypothetical protein